MTTRGIYITPDNIVANKNRKKNMNINDNYPPGAANDPRAPYNQIPDDDFTRTVSASISFDYTISLPVISNESKVKEMVEEQVKDLLIRSLNCRLDNFNIDELKVLK